MAADEPKRSIKIEAFECPFCGHEEGVLTEANIDYGSHEEGFGHDYWECTECGYENPVFPSGDTTLFGETPFFVDINNWAGLEGHLRLGSGAAAMEALFYARFLTQKKEFDKALKIAGIILAVDKDYFEAHTLAERLSRQIFYLNLKSEKPELGIGELMFALDDHSGAEWYFDSETGCTFNVFDSEPDSEINKVKAEPERFIEVFPISSREVFRLMEEFTEMLPEEIGGKLSAALKGRESLRMFKDCLKADEELEKEWYSHYNNLAWLRAMQWLQRNAQPKN